MVALKPRKIRGIFVGKRILRNCVFLFVAEGINQYEQQVCIIDSSMANLLVVGIRRKKEFIVVFLLHSFHTSLKYVIQRTSFAAPNHRIYCSKSFSAICWNDQFCLLYRTAQTIHHTEIALYRQYYCLQLTIQFNYYGLVALPLCIVFLTNCKSTLKKKKSVPKILHKENRFWFLSSV